MIPKNLTLPRLIALGVILLLSALVFITSQPTTSFLAERLGQPKAPTGNFALNNPCALDPKNLFVNGTFAPGNNTPFGLVAANWTPFIFSGDAPTYNVVDNEKIDPQWSQQIFARRAIDAGVQQTLHNLTPGTNYWYRLGYALAAQSINGPNIRVQTIGRQVGVDPTGGTDVHSPSIQWSPVVWDGNPAVNIPALTMVFTAQSSNATIYFRMIATDGSGGENRVWFDAACAEARPDLPPSTPLPGTGATPTWTPVPGTNTPTPTATVTAQNNSCIQNISAIAIGTHPKTIAVDSGSHRAFVALFDSSSIGVINTLTNQRSAVWATDGAGNANGIAYLNGRVYVTKRNNARAFVNDAASGNFIANITVGNLPYGAGAANNRVYVANFNDGTVSVIDPGLNRAIATPFIGGNASHIAAFTDRAYVSYYGGGIAIVGADGTVRGNLNTGGGTFGIAANANRVYFTNRETKQVGVIDANTNAVIQTLTESSTPYALAINPSSNHLFIVQADLNRVRVRDAGTLAFIADVPVGTQGPDGGDGIAVVDNMVYVSNNATNTVSVIADTCSAPATQTATPQPGTNTPTLPNTPAATNTATRTATPTSTATATLAAATSTFTPTPTATATQLAATATQSSVASPTKTNTPTATATSPSACLPSVIGTIPVGAHPKGVAADPGTSRLFVGLYDASAVSVVNANTGSQIATWTTNTSGHANGIAFANGRVWVSLRDAASVAVLDAANGALLGYRFVGALPYGVGAANNRVYVAKFIANSVTVFDATTISAIGSTRTGNYPSLVAAANDRAFVSYWGNGVASVGSDATLKADFSAFGVGTYGVAYNSAANRIYVSNRLSRIVSLVDATSGAVSANVTLAQAPFGMAYNAATNRVFIALAETNQVDVRDGTTLARITLLNSGAMTENGGDGLVLLNGKIYMANYADGTLSVIQDGCAR